MDRPYFVLWRIFGLFFRSSGPKVQKTHDCISESSSISKSLNIQSANESGSLGINCCNRYHCYQAYQPLQDHKNLLLSPSITSMLFPHRLPILNLSHILIRRKRGTKRHKQHPLHLRKTLKGSEPSNPLWYLDAYRKP